VTESYGPPLPVRELRQARLDQLARLRLPYRHLAAVATPAGCLVVAFATDSVLLSRLFAGNWAPADSDRQPDATLRVLARPARGYGLDGTWDEARWWSSSARTMVLFTADYHLVKVCIRGICSAVSGHDLVFLHGCALSVHDRDRSRGVAIMGSSGAGKTALVASVSERRGYAVRVVNDDWGPVSAHSAAASGTGEMRLHMKTQSVLALRPGFFAAVPPDAYARDLSDADPSSRLLVEPEYVYGARWERGIIVIDNIVVIVREPPGWQPPDRPPQALELLSRGGYSGYFRRNEPFFNGSLMLRTEAEWSREVTRYEKLLERVSLSWINNCGTVDELTGKFLSAVMGQVPPPAAGGEPPAS